MRELLVGDLHFGIKTNNITWLSSQLDYVRTQIFDILKNKNIDRIVFLGDLFDIRYAVNQQVGIEVKELVRELANNFSGDIIFIAGNHDYYSPIEEFTKYNTYDLIFGDEFKKCYPNIKFVNKEPLIINDSLFLPWYYTENSDHFDELLYNYDFGREVKAVYCHADLTVWPGSRISALKGIPVYSGHIHFISIDKLANLHNIGAALPLTFNDVNQNRFLYIVEDYEIVEEIENVITPKFKRFYNEKIFELTDKDFDNSYIQLCINSSYINKANYIEQLKYIKSTYISSHIRINVVDNETNYETLEVERFNTNINQYIENNIPEHLENKYNLIKQQLNDNK